MQPLQLLASQFDGSTRGLLLEGDGDVGIRGQPDLVAFDAGHEAHLDIMMMSLVLAEVVTFLELDTIALDAIDLTDMNIVGADHFHAALDL